MDAAEFRRLGYLQELNRRFLHPLGLALEVDIADDGTETIGGIMDCRADPEGVRYQSKESAGFVARCAAIDAEYLDRRTARAEALGYWVQPIDRVTDGT
jgi:hypothetical protein